jgi:hypothetical protein
MYGLFVGVLAVFTSILAMRRRERLYTIGLVLGSVAVIFGNLQNLGVDLSALGRGAKTQSDMRHFYNSINYSIRAYEILEKHQPPKQMGDEQVQTLLRYVDRALKAATMVNLANMERHVPGFARHYEEEFMGGFRSLKAGYEQSHVGKKLKGALLLDRWGKWNRQNRQKLREIKEKKPSLMGLIFS